jgi:hypothetical protein
MDLITRYEENDVMNLMTNLQKGCSENRVDYLTTSSEELKEVLRNLWDDARSVNKTQNKIRFGLSVALGVVGTVATLPALGIGGLLAGLGFNLLDQERGVPISKNIAKQMKPNYLFAIHDFQNKYALN